MFFSHSLILTFCSLCSRMKEQSYAFVVIKNIVFQFQLNLARTFTNNRPQIHLTAITTAKLWRCALFGIAVRGTCAIYNAATHLSLCKHHLEVAIQVVPLGLSMYSITYELYFCSYNLNSIVFKGTYGYSFNIRVHTNFQHSIMHFYSRCCSYSVNLYTNMP